MKVIEQLCIRSHTITDSYGTSFTTEQGKTYTTSIPDDSNTIIVFSRYWTRVPKENFVEAEK